MSQQYMRVIQLLVGTESKMIDLSNLHIRFLAKLWTKQTPANCQIRVWNVSDNTRSYIEKESTRFTLAAGYKAEGPQTIFEGTVVQVRHGRESPVDTYLDITGASGDEFNNWAIVSLPVAAGSTFKDRYDAITRELQKYGITPGHTDTLPDEKLPRGKTMFGMARDQLRDIAAATDTEWSVQGSELLLLSTENPLPGVVIELNSATGLVGFPEQTELGIQAKCLLNPKIKPYVQVKINNQDVQQVQLNLNYRVSPDQVILPSIADDGLYRVLSVEHSGDTRGTEWYPT